jgi:hypothetical protein
MKRRDAWKNIWANVAEDQEIVSISRARQAGKTAPVTRHSFDV